MAKTKVIHVAVEPEMGTKLQREAKAQGVSASVVIRWALKAWFESRRESVA